eukprot:2129544-Rhodomonas_salina.1
MPRPLALPARRGLARPGVGGSSGRQLHRPHMRVELQRSILQDPTASRDDHLATIQHRSMIEQHTRSLVRWCDLRPRTRPHIQHPEVIELLGGACAVVVHTPVHHHQPVHRDRTVALSPTRRRPGAEQRPGLGPDI